MSASGKEGTGEVRPPPPPGGRAGVKQLEELLGRGVKIITAAICGVCYAPGTVQTIYVYSLFYAHSNPLL